MNSILYVGMDVHKENYTLCCYSARRVRNSITTPKGCSMRGSHVIGCKAFSGDDGIRQSKYINTK